MAFSRFTWVGPWSRKPLENAVAFLLAWYTVNSVKLWTHKHIICTVFKFYPANEQWQWLLGECLLKLIQFWNLTLNWKYNQIHEKNVLYPDLIQCHLYILTPTIKKLHKLFCNTCFTNMISLLRACDNLLISAVSALYSAGNWPAYNYFPSTLLLLKKALFRKYIATIKKFSERSADLSSEHLYDLHLTTRTININVMSSADNIAFNIIWSAGQSLWPLSISAGFYYTWCHRKTRPLVSVRQKTCQYSTLSHNFRQMMIILKNYNTFTHSHHLRSHHTLNVLLHHSVKYLASF